MGSYEIRDSDLALLATLMGPEHVLARAEQYGAGCLVSGAPGAFYEAREQVRDYLRFVRHRDQIRARDLGVAMSLRALGYLPYNYKHVKQDLDLWRDTACQIWNKTPGLIPGGVKVNFKGTQIDLDLKVLLVVGQMLKDIPGINKAVLHGKVWQRSTPEVLIPREANGIKSQVINPVGKSTEYIRKRMYRALREMVKVEKRYPKIHYVGIQLLRNWLQEGFITSPAGASVTLVGAAGVPFGFSALVPGNGIPISITVCKLINGEAWITANIDHRAIDGSGAGRIYEYIGDIFNNTGFADP